MELDGALLVLIQLHEGLAARFFRFFSPLPKGMASGERGFERNTRGKLKKKPGDVRTQRNGQKGVAGFFWSWLVL